MNQSNNRRAPQPTSHRYRPNTTMPANPCTEKPALDLPGEQITTSLPPPLALPMRGPSRILQANTGLLSAWHLQTRQIISNGRR